MNDSAKQKLFGNIFKCLASKKGHSSEKENILSYLTTLTSSALISDVILNSSLIQILVNNIIILGIFLLGNVFDEYFIYRITYFALAQNLF